MLNINKEIAQLETELNELKKLRDDLSERIERLEIKLLKLKALTIPEEEFEEDYEEIIEDVKKSLDKKETVSAEEALKELGLL
ncbi:conserved hypothetical protein [Methanocaldococcus sp. FS406-22]|jgi:phage shock protein A|uniref:antitoxin n=1 Tax=Methanocaldococcus sp. (strain FS406-22) TaxID=644281 RepID=UPI0001BF098D|nr:antitoxin [Methanocaldococcus sp. FS406-22]ADC69128.1 conserved hypothetical protein [Methanocaldococcus sp. FS406-22]